MPRAEIIYPLKSPDETIQKFPITGWFEHSDHTIEGNVEGTGEEVLYRIYGKDKITRERRMEVISYSRDHIRKVQGLLNRL